MSNQITAQAMRAKMNLPPALQGPYQRVVLAGQKIMFSEQATSMIQQLMSGPGDVGTKLGQGVEALMAMLIQQSNHTMPPQLIIPAGVELVTDFADLLRKSGVQVSDQDVAKGLETLVSNVMQRVGATPQKMAQLANGGAGGQPAPGAQPPAAPQGAQPQAAPNSTSVATDDQGN